MDHEIDKGHEALLDDVEALHKEVKAFEYHDFKNGTYAAPKMALITRLEGMITDVKEEV